MLESKIKSAVVRMVVLIAVAIFTFKLAGVCLGLRGDDFYKIAYINAIPFIILIAAALMKDGRCFYFSVFIFSVFNFIVYDFFSCSDSAKHGGASFMALIYAFIGPVSVLVGLAIGYVVVKLFIQNREGVG